MTISLIRKYRLIILICLFLISLQFVKGAFAFDASSSAQTSIAKKYNLSFPIAELGNCGSLAECKAYCDDSTHAQACQIFAQKKGFAKKPAGDDSKILADAKQQLGCDSKEACMQLCQNPDNQARCQAFAQAHQLQPPPSSNSQNPTLALAKQVLGCNSIAECKAFCQNPDNAQKCSDFAKQAHLQGGIKKVGPGGCTSEDSCRQYCSQNPQICAQFNREHMASSSGDLRKPDTRSQGKTPFPPKNASDSPQIMHPPFQGNFSPRPIERPEGDFNPQSPPPPTGQFSPR